LSCFERIFAMDGESENSLTSVSENALESTDSNKTVVEKLVKATEYKLAGNDFFKEKNYKKAIRNYHRALMYVKGIEVDGLPHPLRKIKVNIDQSILDQNKKLKMNCYNNLAACLLQLPEPTYDKVVFYCQLVIEACPSNDKAHFRMAQALQKLGDYEKAIESCNQAQKNQNIRDSKVENMKMQCLNELSKQHSNQKAMFSKMLGL